MAAARHVTADAVERGHALFDHHAWSGGYAEAFRHLPASNGANVTRGVTNGAPDRCRSSLGPCANFLSRELDRPSQVVQSSCVSQERPVARPTDVRHDLGHTFVHPFAPVAIDNQQPIDGRDVTRTEDSDRSHDATRSNDDLVQRVLDYALRVCSLQLWDQVADGALLDDRIHGHPLLIAQR